MGISFFYYLTITLGISIKIFKEMYSTNYNINFTPLSSVLLRFIFKFSTHSLIQHNNTLTSRDDYRNSRVV